MSCFSCCEEDEILKASENGQFMANNPSSNYTFSNSFYLRNSVLGRPKFSCLNLLKSLCFFSFVTEKKGKPLMDRDAAG